MTIGTANVQAHPKSCICCKAFPFALKLSNAVKMARTSTETLAAGQRKAVAAAGRPKERKPKAPAAGNRAAAEAERALAAVLLIQRLVRGWRGRERFAWAVRDRAREPGDGLCGTQHS